MKTIVVFRKFKEGDILALFPAERGDNNWAVSSYMHVGQHGAADYTGCIRLTKPATPEEYAPLKRELESIGYVLDVKKRFISKKQKAGAK